MTVVIVNWNSLDMLRTTLEAVRRFSPERTRVIVVDNASTDGSVDWLRRHGVDSIMLGENIGHGAALDRGVLAARTRYVVSLDVDAFPIVGGWLDCLVNMLEGGALVAGARGGEVLDRLTPDQPSGWDGREFVHPCCLAMELRYFAATDLTFRKNAASWLDTGQLISVRAGERIAFLEPTSTVGPGALGTVFGDVVYHNFYGTRHGRQGVVVNGISVDDARRVWDESVAKYLSEPGRR